MQKKKVELKDINLDPRNTRKHNEKNIKVIKESLEKFGQYRPFVIQEEGMIIRVGNGMYQAMQELGIKEADAVIIDLNDDEATALSIIDNRSSELATWDDDLLAELLKDMPDDLFNITGFDDFFNPISETVPSLEELTEEYGDEPLEDSFYPILRLKVTPEAKSLFESLMKQASGDNEYEKFDIIVNAIDKDKIK